MVRYTFRYKEINQVTNQMNKLSVLSIAIYSTLAISVVNVVFSTMTNTKLDIMDNRMDAVEKEMLRLEGRLNVVEEKLK